MLQCRMQKRLTRIGTDIVNMEMETNDGGHIPAQYQDLSYPREIQGLCGRMQQDTATLAPHLSWYPNGIHEEEQFWLEERRKCVGGNDWVPGREEPNKLRGSTKSRKEPVRPRAGKDRVHHRLWQHRSHLRSRRTTDCGCMWTTELSIKPR